VSLAQTAGSVLPSQTQTPRDRHLRRGLAQNDMRAQTPLLRPMHPHQEERAAGTDAGAGADISVHGSSPLCLLWEKRTGKGGRSALLLVVAKSLRVGVLYVF
jgi:hypothetical protein